MIKIKNLIKIILSWPKKYTVLLPLIVLIGVAGYVYFTREKVVEYEYVTAERSNLVQEVSVTGKVKPASKVDLAFELSGKVLGIYADVGDKVYSGQKIAIMDSTQYQAQYNQAQAGWEVEQLKLDELNVGTRSEEIAVQEVKVQNAEQSLIDAENNMVVNIKDTFTKADDAIRNKADQLFDNPRSSNPQLNFTTGFVLKSQIESDRISVEEILNQWSIDGVNLDNFSSKIQTIKTNLNKLASFLDEMSLAVNGMSITTTLTQTIVDGYKADINTARVNINTALSNMGTAEEKWRVAKSALGLAQQELILKKAGSTSEQIRSQEAKVASAKANMDNYKALINKTVIFSPISGVITKKNIEVGEIAQASSDILTIISEGEYEIETFVPEVDIAKISIGNTAKIILDAYDEDFVNFEAKIIFIDPAETIIEGVSTYKIKLRFTQKDERIKSGMTANIDILTASKENVILIPYRAVKTNGGDNYVEVLVGEEVVEKKIETGMRSTDGQIEIISGVEEGDKVITSK
ncbi:efflux RND transporter periplasmic adaptor subunit [Patescibacteria group bacterium]|nr:efflux RND transporter periplasmic adaptor subunit [Patescibacteria group bacterium]MCG2694527.1 efflux RND transporter periplasmic adaptor subunit [Candidatus Parcubacteria bacterium]